MGKKLFRYRKPSVKTALGVTKAKRRVTKATGGKAVRDPSVLITNANRRIKRKVGYYSAPAKATRAKGCYFLGIRLAVLTLILVVIVLYL